jgi:hypothetical protein
MRKNLSYIHLCWGRCGSSHLSQIGGYVFFTLKKMTRYSQAVDLMHKPLLQRASRGDAGPFGTIRLRGLVKLEHFQNLRLVS